MSAVTRAVAKLRSSSRRRQLWRSLLAAPFGLSLALALLMGPATIDNPHASFAWLAAWSLIAALGMLLPADGLLILLGLATLDAFPLLAGLGFDGSEAFWTSTRPGGLGGNDIWTSRRVDGSWTTPENLGPAINSPASEHHSIPSADGRSLHVTSDREGGYGGDDMYVAARGAAGMLADLAHLRPQLNGPGSDRCAEWTPDGTILLIDSDRPGGFGSKDLWWVESSDLAPATAREGP